MNKKQFMQDVWDVLMGNTEYITQERFAEKYKDMFIELDCTRGIIKLADDHNEWQLTLQKVWCDEWQ